MAVALLILDDGVTYSRIEGASICVISEEEYEEVLNGDLKLKNVTPIIEIGLTEG